VPARTNYLEYFYPGIVILALLFTAIFSTISTVEDRREGFLQGVLVAPVPRWAIVLGQGARRHVTRCHARHTAAAGGAADRNSLSVASVLSSIAVMSIVALALTGLG